MSEDQPLTPTWRRLSVDSHVVDVRNTPPRDGRPVVMVHGIGVAGDYFLPFARVVGRRRPVYLLDLPGYGTTPKPPRPLTVPELGDVAARTITMPGLVVRGARDPIAPADWVRRLAALAPDATSAEVPGAAHNAQHTHPDELAATCAPFLSRFA